MDENIDIYYAWLKYIKNMQEQNDLSPVVQEEAFNEKEGDSFSDSLNQEEDYS